MSRLQHYLLLFDHVEGRHANYFPSGIAGSKCLAGL